MDPSSSVRTDTLPAVATLLIPGSIASGGYLWAGLRPHAAFIVANEWIAGALILLAAVFAGFLVDSLASYVEVHGFDRRRANPEAAVEDWWVYLTTPWEHRPVGLDYISRMVTTLKFELNGFVAAMLALPSIPVLVHRQLLPLGAAQGVALGLAILAVVLLFMAKGSSDVLADARRRLVRSLPPPRIPGPGEADEQTYEVTGRLRATRS